MTMEIEKYKFRTGAVTRVCRRCKAIYYPEYYDLLGCHLLKGGGYCPNCAMRLYEESEVKEKLETELGKREKLMGLLNLTSWDNTFENCRAVKGTMEAINTFKALADKADWYMLLCYGSTGCGKCLAKGTKIILANGNLCAVENIKEGDALLGAKGDIKQVSGLYHGYGELYRIKQNFGQDYIVNKNHILYLKKSIACAKSKGERMPSGNWRRPRGKYPNELDEVCISVNDYLKKSNCWKRTFYGYHTRVEFPYSNVKIDSYLLGLWLGDGDSSRVVFTTATTEIKNYLYAYASKRGMKVSIYPQNHNKSLRYKLIKYRNDGLTKRFKHYNLLDNKHIPLEYLHNSRKIRLSVLAGIIDTDGHLYGNCYEIIQKSYKLAKDIEYLCHSLGFKCSVKLVTKRIKKSGFVGDYYRLVVSGGVKIIPVKVERKRIITINNNKNPSVTLIKVEYAGMGDYYGFDIGGDGLFLLEDFTVTHNTHLCEALSIGLSRQNILCRVNEWAELIREFKRDMHSEHPTDYDEHFERIRQQKRLIIDDVGMGSVGSSWEWGELEDIVNYRYRQGLLTVITTNLDITKFPDRIISRFRDITKSRIVLMGAEDYRPKLKNREESNGRNT